MTKYDDDYYYTAEDINDELDDLGDDIYDDDDKMQEFRLYRKSSTKKTIYHKSKASKLRFLKPFLRLVYYLKQSC